MPDTDDTDDYAGEPIFPPYIYAQFFKGKLWIEG